MNKFLISGRTTKDLVLETTAHGKPFTVLTIAENYGYIKDGQKFESVNYFRILAYGEQAKNAVKFCGKGSYLLIEARIENDNYEKDGHKIYKDAMIARHIEYAALKAPVGGSAAEDLPAFTYDPEQEVK